MLFNYLQGNIFCLFAVFILMYFTANIFLVLSEFFEFFNTFTTVLLLFNLVILITPLIFISNLNWYN